MSSVAEARAPRADWLRVLDLLSMPALAMVLAFVGGALIIWITSGSLITVGEAYGGMINGAFFKTRGFSETLVATTPYIFLGLALALGFKAGLFNIGVEGQFFVGAIGAAWVGSAFSGLPAIIHLPLALGAGALGGALWAMIPGYLKAKTGAHEVINTIMMNYIAFRLTEFVVSGPLRDAHSSAVQTPRVAPNAELWSLYAIPERLGDPLNALGVALVCAFLGWTFATWQTARPSAARRFASASQRRLATLGVGAVVGIVTFLVLPPLTRAWWLLNDQYDRLHIGIFLALVTAVAVWRLLWKTTLGFEMRMVGANPDAAKYAGINSTRNIVVTMALSGALAGVAGTIEVLGVSICRCLPLFFSSGYGFDSIAIALLAQNHPFGIVLGSFVFGAMRNGADLMELNSGVSKYVISLIQGLVLLFVAAPAMVRWLLRLRARAGEEQATITRGWGG
ncbi:MAG: ABC transporter permease [Chloroflexi bacterium]|nr:ABC transporter permease [Chloroflexota bacterium]